MSRVPNLGMSRDMKERDTLARVDDRVRQNKVKSARAHIYGSALGVTSTAVENLLRDQSLVPASVSFVISSPLNHDHSVKNAFSDRLAFLGFNLFCMLVVDLMHEFELGVWKALFTHLLWILGSAQAGDTLVNELDRRYRMVPTFSGDTIRKFASNTSEMKRMAARDFEDVLQVSLHENHLLPLLRDDQCAIPVFDALLPEPYNKNVLALLFTCAHWHALAKLRMHTDETLSLLDTITERLGKRLRHFQRRTCTAFDTKELKREADSRQRRELKTGVASTSQAARRQKTFNLETYKLHALGDYASSIRKYGTTDSYSTEPARNSRRTDSFLLT